MLLIKTITTAFCIGLFLYSSGQCDPSIIPSGDENDRYQDRTNRCEGEYEKNQSSIDGLILTQCTRGRFRYVFNKNDTIKIQTYKNNEIKIKSIPHSKIRSYRMDAVIKNNKVFYWPTKDVLNSMRFESKDIGVYGWYGESGNEVYVPVSAQTTLNKQKDSTIILKFVLDKAINKVEWTIKNAQNKELLPCKVLEKNYWSDTPVKASFIDKYNSIITFHIKFYVNDIKYDSKEYKIDLTK